MHSKKIAFPGLKSSYALVIIAVGWPSTGQDTDCIFKLCDLAMNLQFAIIRTSQLKPVQRYCKV